jgi:hypothetical protein
MNRYFDNFCSYEEKINPHRYIFKGPCIKCKKIIEVAVRGPELYRYRQGDFIQDALKSNTPEEREFLMSGICGKCWDEISDPPKDLEDQDLEDLEELMKIEGRKNILNPQRLLKPEEYVDLDDLGRIVTFKETGRFIEPEEPDIPENTPEDFDLH